MTASDASIEALRDRVASDATIAEVLDELLALRAVADAAKRVFIYRATSSCSCPKNSYDDSNERLGAALKAADR